MDAAAGIASFSLPIEFRRTQGYRAEAILGKTKFIGFSSCHQIFTHFLKIEKAKHLTVASKIFGFFQVNKLSCGR